MLNLFHYNMLKHVAYLDVSNMAHNPILVLQLMDNMLHEYIKICLHQNRVYIVKRV